MNSKINVDFTFPTIVTIILVGLKVREVLDISWIIVISPVLLSTLLSVILLILFWIKHK